jgi:hypothetical protein
LLKPLPFAQPAHLVGIFHLSEGRRTTMSGPNFWDLKKQSQTLADAAAFSRVRMILTGQGEPVRLDGADVTGSFFDVLDPGFRVEPALTFELSLPDSRYGREPQQVMFFDQLLPRLKSIPGVRSAGAVLSLPLSGTSVVLTL